MKSIFSACKFFFYFFVVYVFSSCKSYLMVDGKQVPKNVTIYVTSYDLGNGNLTLKDVFNNSADPFDALPGQHIRWKVTATGHLKIDTVYEKTAKKKADDSFFEKDPHKVFLSKSWKAIVNVREKLKAIAAKNGSGKCVYEYNMDWTNGSHCHTFDPKIQINVIF